VSFWLTARGLAGSLGEAVNAGLSWHDAKASVGKSYCEYQELTDQGSRYMVAETLAFAERWLESGLPHVFVGEKIAAS
jgi:hypothetical protein